jgi:dephospho-CoA kinase
MSIIHVIGNLCSGKSTFCKEVKKEFPKFIVVSIDQFRKLYSDGTIEGETKAWEKLLEKVQSLHEKKRIVLLESSGTAWRLKYFPMSFIIYVDTPEEVCYDRARERGKTDVPWCYGGHPWDSVRPIQEKIDEKIRYYSYYYPNKLFFKSKFETPKDLIVQLLNSIL